MDGSRFWKDFEGKKVYIILKSGRNYSGTIEKIEINPPLVWIKLIDKFNNPIVFSAGEISSIEEQQERRYEEE